MLPLGQWCLGLLTAILLLSVWHPLQVQMECSDVLSVSLRISCQKQLFSCCWGPFDSLASQDWYSQSFLLPKNPNSSSLFGSLSMTNFSLLVTVKGLM